MRMRRYDGGEYVSEVRKLVIVRLGRFSCFLPAPRLATLLHPPSRAQTSNSRLGLRPLHQLVPKVLDGYTSIKRCHQLGIYWRRVVVV